MVYQWQSHFVQSMPLDRWFVKYFHLEVSDYGIRADVLSMFITTMFKCVSHGQVWFSKLFWDNYSRSWVRSRVYFYVYKFWLQILLVYSTGIKKKVTAIFWIVVMLPLYWIKDGAHYLVGLKFNIPKSYIWAHIWKGKLMRINIHVRTDIWKFLVFEIFGVTCNNSRG